MANLLLVEDDATLGMTLEVSLASAAHDVSWCRTLSDAHESVVQSPPDLILLDLTLPDGDGLAFCKTVRQKGSIAPILIITARETVYARVAGLNSGADDYVTKPFELPELLARIEALLRRQRWHGPGEKAQVGRLEIDFGRREAWSDGEPVPMTELEFRLIRYFMDHKNQAVARESLLSRVWEQDPSTQTRTVDVFVGRLRRYVEENPSKPDYLVNVRGVGYKLQLD